MAKVSRECFLGFNPDFAVSLIYIWAFDEILLLQKSIGAPFYGKWGLPGGKLKNNEDPLQGVIRETFEETNIILTQKLIQSLGKLYVQLDTMSFICYQFAYQTWEKFPVSLSNEHCRFLWVNRNKFLNMDLFEGEKEAFMLYQEKSEFREFYFLRHGQTDANINIKKADYDLPLNKAGIEQAQSIKEKVNRLSIGRAYYSSLMRTRQTLDIVLDLHDREKTLNSYLNECSIDLWNKMLYLENKNAKKLEKDIHEFFQTVYKGLHNTLENEKPPLLVAHGGVHFAICYLLQITDHPWKINNCELVHFKEVQSNKWVAKRIETH